jgi:hypothetical protein
MTSLVHNGCRLCVETEGTCWRADMMERYRAARSFTLGLVRRRFVKALFAVLLAPILGGLTGGTIAMGAWIVVRARMDNLNLIAESIKLLRG